MVFRDDAFDETRFMALSLTCPRDRRSLLQRSWRCPVYAVRQDIQRIGFDAPMLLGTAQLSECSLTVSLCVARNRRNNDGQKMRIGSREFLVLLSSSILLAFLAHSYFFRLDEVVALRGFSILEVLAAHADPAAFARDYPGGSRLTTTNSPTVHIYTFGQDHLGLDGLSMLYGMILLEILVLTSGLWLLWSAVLDRCGVAGLVQDGVVRIVFVWLVLLVLISSLQRINMVNFGFPFFHGQFYGFADGLRLAALAMIVRRRWELAALAFVLCFMVHPIKAMMASILALGLLAVDWKKSFGWRSMATIAATLFGWIGWYALALRGDAEGVPLEPYVAYTRTLQSHWYPIDLGLLGKWHERGITTLMSLLLTAFITLRQPGWPQSLRDGLLVGILLLLVVTGVGIWISVAPTSTTLVRISLGRATTMISLVAPLIIMVGAVFAWRDNRMLVFAGLLAFVWVGFLGNDMYAEFAPAFPCLLAVIHVIRQPRDAIPMILLAGPVAAISIWYWISFPKDVGFLVFALVAVFWAILLIQRGLTNLSGSREQSVPVSLVVISLFFAAGGGYWAFDRVERVSKKRDLAQAYLETQLWARKETPSGTLFMVDPCRWYGWRDFSHRASIGTMREWYMTAWLYNDRAELLEQGHEIAVTLGAGFEPEDAKPLESRVMCKTARTAYYAPELAGVRRVAEKFGVDYFVFEKALSKRLPDYVTENFAFENEHFAILSADRLGHDG